MRKDNYFWPKSADNIIARYYPQGGPEACIDAGIVVQKKRAIMRRASTLGVKRTRIKGAWSDAEIHILRKGWPTMGSRIADSIPNRSVTACQKKARDLKLYMEPRAKKIALAADGQPTSVYLPTLVLKMRSNPIKHLAHSEAWIK